MIEKNVFIPNLSSYIMDLYLILFIEQMFPWNDIKYEKRLNRIVLFITIDILVVVSTHNKSLL